MLIPIISALAAILLISFPVRALISFRKILSAARKTGLPYVITPVYVWNPFWLLSRPLISYILENAPFIPKSWLKSYSWRVTHGDFAYYEGWKIHEELGSDTFLLVSPWTFFMFTADPTIINHICNSREQFRKPIELYEVTNIYGQNVLTTEGAVWRRHRKVVGVLGEKSTRGVWIESLWQAREMVGYWLRDPHATQKMNGQIKSSERGWSIQNVSRDAMRLSLYVISRAGFGVRCSWPGMEDEGSKGAISATGIRGSHKMSYMVSMETLLHQLITIIMLPTWFLDNLPIKSMRNASLAFREWGQYMSEIYQNRAESENSDASADLMGSMIKASQTGNANASLSQVEIFGNSFIFFLAGHETTANTIHFAIYYLSTRPELQHKLQAEVDSIVGDVKIEDWSYDEHLPKFFSGLLGATMNETLRLIPPVQVLPKRAPKAQPMITSDGHEFILPDGAMIGLSAHTVHRNPRYWPHEERDDGTHELEEFRPERWLKTEVKSKSQEDFNLVTAEGEENVDTSPDTADSMLTPPKGSYMPFSIGARACIGRRFAQVEILAVLAVILKQYTIELEPEQDISHLDRSERKLVWEKTKAVAERKFKSEMSSVLTIQLRGEPIKFRISKRGEELFELDD